MFRVLLSAWGSARGGSLQTMRGRRGGCALLAMGMAAVACGSRTSLWNQSAPAKDASAPTVECRGSDFPASDYDAGYAITACLPTSPSTVIRSTAPEKIFQVLGDVDRQSPPRPTRNQTVSRYGLIGADEGYSVEHHGKLFFLMDDAIGLDPDDPLRPRNADVVAWTDDLTGSGADEGFDLQLYTDVDGKYLGLRVDGHFLCENDGPGSGVSDGPNLYAFFYENAHAGEIDPRTGQIIEYGFLGVSTDDARTFHRLYELPSSWMVYVQPVVVATASLPRLPWSDDPTVLIFGRRTSEAPIVAAAPLDRLADPGAWVWWTGAAFSPSDADSARAYCPGTSADPVCLGNFSVSFVPGLGKWLMTLRCNPPREPSSGDGFYVGYRTADSPLGPWSPLAVYFSPRYDGGYCNYMHLCCSGGIDSGGCERSCCDDDYTPIYDSPHDPAFGVTGNAFPYGPFVIQGWDRWDPETGQATIYTLVSTSNPYSPQLLRTTLRAP
jgi:hypothetical protein